ncbi:hypothetical protein V5O48_016482 [Marasmius crinis-equi]|uniref:Uncharacterized protein n=1 Tax=Marasmius crinis-equi TaxID=585013 RepID=A0ABR3ERW2_9AGAR
MAWNVHVCLLSFRNQCLERQQQYREDNPDNPLIFFINLTVIPLSTEAVSPQDASGFIKAIKDERWEGVLELALGTEGSEPLMLTIAEAAMGLLHWFGLAEDQVSGGYTRDLRLYQFRKGFAKIVHGVRIAAFDTHK